MAIDLRDVIIHKRDGGELTRPQIDRVVAAAADGSGSEAQLAAWLMAVFVRRMNGRERADYVAAMAASGVTFEWGHLPNPTADKHSTGGVGDKVSLPWAPLMAAAGVAVPMISGRGLGLTGGTLDKLESIPGYRCDLDGDEFRRVVAEVGCSITGQTRDLVPADRVLYDLRNRTGTIETLDHIAPSILSKKLAEGARHLVLDVKVGAGAFMKTEAQARELAETMVALGESQGRRVVALLTDMDRLLGDTAGNALEVEESMDLLAGGGSRDARDLTLELAAEALVSAGRSPGLPEARRVLGTLLEGGQAMERWERMVRAQGGDLDAFHRRERVDVRVVESPRDGWIDSVEALPAGRAVAALGGVRGGDGAAPDPEVGIRVRVAPGSPVARGQPLVDVHHRNGTGLDEALLHVRQALRVAETPAPVRTRVLGRVGRDHGV